MKKISSDIRKKGRLSKNSLLQPGSQNSMH